MSNTRLREDASHPSPAALKLCPFCGAKAISFQWKSSQTARTFYRVGCDADNPPGCAAEPFTDGDTEVEAIDAWNRRAGEAT